MPDDRTLPLRTSGDVARARAAVRDAMQAIGASVLETTKFVTAASELARNALLHGGGGAMTLSFVERPRNRGVALTFTDQGPGIEDVARAMTDGFTTRGGLGLGLGGARRLASDFAIDSPPGGGTRVRITAWVADR